MKRPYEAVIRAHNVYLLVSKDKKRFESDGQAIQQCIKDALNGNVYALKQIALCTGDALTQAYLEELK